MEIISNAKRVLRPVGRKLYEHGPTIAVVAGGAATLVSTVLACKATLKLDAVLEERERKAEEVKAAAEELVEDAESGYSGKDLSHDLMLVNAQCWGKVARAYLPSALTWAFGMALIGWSHMEMSSRLSAMTAYAMMVEQAYSKLREHVGGVDKARDAMWEYEEAPDDGSGEAGGTWRCELPDGYFRYLDQYNTNLWTKSRSHNRDTWMMCISNLQRRMERDEKHALTMDWVFDEFRFEYDDILPKGIARNLGVFMEELPEGQLYNALGLDKEWNKEALYGNRARSDNAKDCPVVLDFSYFHFIADQI